VVPPGDSTAAAREQELARLRLVADAADAWARWRRQGETEAASPQELELLAALDRLESADSPRSLIVLCSGCRRTRDDSAWVPLETYLVEQTPMEFSQGLCPDCMARLYPQHRAEPD
jgi:hypothetical protein